ncbi:RidA family protein [Phycisphaerales bacterium AB-hyl4]|uniref:RidA family protein n=1 Tax=Natronomicrosphaera hydrolytica TaxID=3242702 RepID=A0ABV4U9M5_9BACT
MSSLFQANPFPQADADRHAIWQMLVKRDFDAFLQRDWSIVADDFQEDEFEGLNAHFRANPDAWRLQFAELSAYRDSWLKQASDFASVQVQGDREAALYTATVLRDIEIQGDRAIAHKKFDGQVPLEGGGAITLCWQTLYRLRRIDGRWKIVGFVGYLPNPMGSAASPGAGAEADRPQKHRPHTARQHVGAGPYSPVLEVDADRLVVISGQGPLNEAGAVVGETIEQQTQVTLTNCQRQLAEAGCTFADVFKVNVYLADLDEWPRFNAVYQDAMPEPRPVRTAVGTALLLAMRVEIEMWAIKRR